MICVLDIETIPDTYLLVQNFGFDGDELAICTQAFAHQAQKSGSEFLPIPFHRIISVSSVLCDDFGHFIKVGNFGLKASEAYMQSTRDLQALNNLESGILRDFWEWFNAKQPSIVSFNGRGFDMVALTLRAMRYHIQAGAYFEINNPQYNKNKWENYRQRYAENFHTDLLDSLGGFGAVRGLTLDSVCKMCGIVGKYDVSGSQVHEIFFDPHLTNKEALEKIQEYCQSDVLNTYWLYLKYLLLKGELLESDYVLILQEFQAKLPQNQGYFESFYTQIAQELATFTI